MCFALLNIYTREMSDRHMLSLANCIWCLDNCTNPAGPDFRNIAGSTALILVPVGKPLPESDCFPA